MDEYGEQPGVGREQDHRVNARHRRLRRQQLGRILGLSATTAIPLTWNSPRIESALLPAHAQTTAGATPGVFNQAAHVAALTPRLLDLIAAPAHAVEEFPQQLVDLCISLSEAGTWTVSATVKNWAFATDTEGYAVFEGTVPPGTSGSAYVPLTDISSICASDPDAGNPDGDGFECRLYDFVETPGARTITIDFRIINNNSSSTTAQGSPVDEKLATVCAEGGDCPIGCGRARLATIRGIRRLPDAERGSDH